MKQILLAMKELGYNPKKQFLGYIIGLLLIVGAGVGLYLYKGLSFLLAIPGLLFIFYTYFYFSRYTSQLKNLYNERMDEFIRLFTFLGIYINDGFNVFRALESIKPFASKNFLPLLDRLLQEIEMDKTVAPFIHFSSAFIDISVKEVMISVYQMVDEGQGGPYIAQFQHIFGKLSDEKHALAKQKRIDGLGKMSILPLVGSGITMFMITLSLFEVMGDVMNVL